MANLISPGTSVTIIDESNYTPGSKGTIPFILLATAENKANPAGTLATYTTAANAGKPLLVTSQRELINAFGKPNFYAPNGTPVHGYELNEYGLLAAYTTLGVASMAYVMRADIDLNALASKLTRPMADPVNGTQWFDTDTSKFGIFEWNATTSTFTNITTASVSGQGKLHVLTNTAYVTGSLPIPSIGKAGDYAIVATNANNPVYYKNRNSDWVLVGSMDWQDTVPTVLGSVANPGTTVGHTFVINGETITLTGTTATSAASDINGAAIDGVTADVINNRLAIFVNSDAASGGELTLVAGGSGSALSNLGLVAGDYFRPTFYASKHTQTPAWRTVDATPRPTGSIWLKTTTPNNGVSLAVKSWNSATGKWDAKTVKVYANDLAANYDQDIAGGGVNIPSGTVYAQYDYENMEEFTIKFYTRRAGVSQVTGSTTSPVFAAGTKTFTVQASSAGSTGLSGSATVSFTGITANDFIAAVNQAGVDNVSAVRESTGAITLVHSEGGVIVLTDGTNTPLSTAGITSSRPGAKAYQGGASIEVSNWIVSTYTASPDAPQRDPDDGTYWYYNEPTEHDFMINDGSAWVGYRNLELDSRGYDLTLCDPAGPICSSSAPTEQSTGDALAYGDLWVDLSNLEDFPKLHRYELVDGKSKWVALDLTDQTSENGVLFADARWTTNGDDDVVTGDIASIATLTTSDYTDPDCPSYALYPRGTLLWNTRRSGMNVKQFTVGAFDDYESPPAYTNTWVSVSGLDQNGVAYMGRKAQRNLITAALVSAVANSTEILEEARDFNLMSCPGYPELTSTLQQLNVNRKETAFILADAPMRLAANSNTLNAWANNLNLAADNGEQGFTSNYEYLAVYYPAGLARDLDGNSVVVPASHIMLRTMIRSDQKSYVWFAPAGLRRGAVDNVSSVGYIDAQTAEYKTIGVNQGLRDVLYDGRVNPIAVLNGSGVTVYGQKTRYGLVSALDRINVARLVVYLRKQLDLIARQYVFEPNDELTRKDIKAQIEKELNSIKSQRGLYDYAVVCDSSNNTTDRIDKNELWVDVAIEPVKAAEFIYIPVRVKNTGDIAAGL